MRETTGLDQLLDIMRDPVSGLRNRLSAAIAASRVERLAMPGESEPEGVQFLREIVGTEREGSRFKVEYRTEAARALSYYERRAKKTALTFAVTDTTEQTNAWRRIINGMIRLNLTRNGRWSQDKHCLIAPNDTDFARPPIDPELARAAILLPVANRHERRKRAVDDPGGPAMIANEVERMSIIRQIAEAAKR